MITHKSCNPEALHMTHRHISIFSPAKGTAHITLGECPPPPPLVSLVSFMNFLRFVSCLLPKPRKFAYFLSVNEPSPEQGWNASVQKKFLCIHGQSSHHRSSSSVSLMELLFQLPICSYFSSLFDGCFISPICCLYQVLSKIIQSIPTCY